MLTPKEQELTKKLIAAGASNDDIKVELERYRAKINTPKPKTGIAKILETITGPKGKTATGETQLGSFLSSATKALPKVGSSLVGFSGQLSRLAPGDQSADPESYYNKTQQAQERFDTMLDKKVDPVFGSAEQAYPGIAMAGDIAPSLISGNMALKGANMLGKTKGLALLTEKFPKIARYTAPIAKSAASGAGYDIANEGKIGEGTAISTALGTLGSGVRIGKDIAKGLGFTKSSIAQSLQLDTVLSSGAKEKVATQLGMSKENLSKWFTERGYSGNLGQIKEQVAGRSKEATAALKEFYGRTSQNPNLRLQSEGVRGVYNFVKNNIDDIDIDKATKKELQSILKEWTGNRKTLSPLSMQRLKQIFDDGINVFKADGTPMKGAKDLAKSRGAIQKTLENLGNKYGVNVGELNKEVQIGSIMAKDLFKREIKDVLIGTAKMGLPAGASLGTLGYVGASGAGSENAGAFGLAGLLIGVTGGLVLQNTKTRTALAKWIQKNMSKELTELDRYRKLGGKKAIPDKVIDRIYRKAQEGLKLLGPGDGVATKPQTVNITPESIPVGPTNKFNPKVMSPTDYLTK